MEKKLYQKIASLINVRNNCEKAGNWKWFDRHSDKLSEIERNYLPSGSGIDNGCSIDLDMSNDNLIVINSSYHTMDENGYYGEWVPFTVTVKPSLVGEIELYIKGPFSSVRDAGEMLKEYLYDVFYNALTDKVDV